MTLLVRDEEDILGSHIDFHLSRGVDHVIAMDNLSQDGSVAILERYRRTGRLTLLHQRDDTYAQGVWVTQMARSAHADHGADWVVNSDADEFWWPRGGNLKAALSAVPDAVQAVEVERVNFLPPAPQAPAGPFHHAMTVREHRSFNTLGHPLPSKLAHRGYGDVVVEQGNHHASRKGAPLIATAEPAIAILHFPVRSYAQFANKIAKGGAAYRRNRDLPDTVGETWRRLHDLQLRGELRRSYDALAPGPAERRDGLAAGRLVRDTRLRDALDASVLAVSGAR